MKTTVGKGLTGTLVLAAALVAGTGGTAHALTNILTGNVCSPYYPPEVVDGQGLLHDSGGIFNTASYDRWVQCPILRDNTTNTNGMQKLTVNMWVGAGPVNSGCTAYFTTKFGSFKKSFALVVNVGSSGSSMTWQSGGAINQSDNGSGGYGVQCRIGPGVALSSIEYQEP